MIYRLDKHIIAFPDPRCGEKEGIFAVGGDLSVERLLLAYHNGIFPWYSFRDSIIEWWCPMDRFVLFPGEVHISHSMRSLINKNKYTVTFNKDFEGVILNCAQLRIEEEGAWLGPDMLEAYTRLHQKGYAMSVEVWNAENNLVGGFYGVKLSNCFFGESMFSLEPNTSKLALIAFCQDFAQQGGVMINCQVESKHLKSMGARHIPYDEYLKLVNAEK